MISDREIPADWLLSKILYKPLRSTTNNYKLKSLTVFGFDTEAYRSGKPFMFCTSEGDVFKYTDIPHRLFSRKYQNANFVTYNLRYDSGAILHHLPREKLRELQENDECENNGYKYKVIANKYLSIVKGKNAIKFWDIFTFYMTSLDNAAKTFLGEGKLEQDVTLYNYKYVQRNWDDIAKYCIRDADLTKRLAQIAISKFEDFGVYPQKLYSTAYISWEYFRKKCDYIHVKRQYQKNPRVLEYALQAYNGGKFEVTRKGPGYYYEYDIVSAYPYEIANLVDIRNAKHCREAKYHKNAVYGFLLCDITIPQNVSSPVAIKRGSLNIYPEGRYTKIITKQEYEYLISHNANINIIDAEWLFVSSKRYPYKREIHRLMNYKNRYKQEGKLIDYHIIKIFLNSFYGKMIQMYDDDGLLKTGTAWNPIYGSVITANTRIRIAELQTRYPEIVAVHTDSVIATHELPIHQGSGLGDWEKSGEGSGVILGTGIYQIGSKSRFRGFRTKTPLLDILPQRGPKHVMERTAPLSWRQVAFRGLDSSNINYFRNEQKIITPASDQKRVWIDDYTDFAEIRHRNVESVAYFVDGLTDWLTFT